MNMRGGSILLLHNKVSGGVQYSQIMISSFFDRFYVMPPLTNGVHYTRKNPECVRCVDLEKNLQLRACESGSSAPAPSRSQRNRMQGCIFHGGADQERRLRSGNDDGNKRSVLGTSSCMPTVFGCHCAAEVLRRITENS